MVFFSLFWGTQTCILSPFQIIVNNLIHNFCSSGKFYKTEEIEYFFLAKEGMRNHFKRRRESRGNSYLILKFCENREITHRYSGKQRIRIAKNTWKNSLRTSFEGLLKSDAEKCYTDRRHNDGKGVGNIRFHAIYIHVLHSEFNSLRRVQTGKLIFLFSSKNQITRKHLKTLMSGPDGTLLMIYHIKDPSE